MVFHFSHPSLWVCIGYMYVLNIIMNGMDGSDSAVTDFHCHLIYDLRAMAPTQDE